MAKLQGGYGKKLFEKAKPHAKKYGGKALTQSVAHARKANDWRKAQQKKGDERRKKRRKELGLDRFDDLGKW